MSREEYSDRIILDVADAVRLRVLQVPQQSVSPAQHSPTPAYPQYPVPLVRVLHVDLDAEHLRLLDGHTAADVFDIIEVAHEVALEVRPLQGLLAHGARPILLELITALGADLRQPRLADPERRQAGRARGGRAR